MDMNPTQANERKWNSLSVSKDTVSRMDKIRKKKELELGLSLSWEHFFSAILPDLEKAVDGNGKRPVR